jgi:hypothetical protein
MEQAITNWPVLLEIVKATGPTGLVLILWFFARRDSERMFKDYRTDMQTVLAQYQRDMTDQRVMYDNNVELVKRVLTIADEQQEVIIMNTRIQQSLVDRIESNQFCPMVRLQKVQGADVVRGI